MKTPVAHIDYLSRKKTTCTETRICCLEIIIVSVVQQKRRTVFPPSTLCQVAVRKLSPEQTQGSPRLAGGVPSCGGNAGADNGR